MLTKTEAIVLKSMKYRDTSKIITFYTKEFGRINGIAKGARTFKNKFGSSLEPMTHSMLLIYKKEHRDLHLISQCDAIDSFRNISNDLNRMASALAVIELVCQVTHDEERNDRLFGLLVETLGTMNSNGKKYDIYLQAFKLKIATIFGYMPNFNSCYKCGRSLDEVKNENPVAFQITRGAVFCDRCYDIKNISIDIQGEKRELTLFSSKGLQIANKLLNAGWLSLDAIEYDMETGNEIDRLIGLYLQYHFDGFKNLKSIEYFQK